MNKYNLINDMKDLVAQLNEANLAYYKYDSPIMSDKEYDDLYDKLLELENETKTIVSNSPTQKVQGELLETLPAVRHVQPMLSANKTKDIKEIGKFISDKLAIASYKLDGLTLVISYFNGKLSNVLTRGDGEFGEDVTAQARLIYGLPLAIDYQEELVIRGECVISWDNFNMINESLEDPYKHPRNLAAGSIRTLNTNVTKERMLELVAFDIISGDEKLLESKSFSLQWLNAMGFTTVENKTCKNMTEIKEIISSLTAEDSKYPVDGIIFELDDIKYGKSLGSTGHHPLNMMALKWEDELFETALLGVEWSTTRTGLVNPIAIFSPVDLNGAVTTRATLHNISYIEDLQLGIGDIIQVFRANMVIPKVHNSLTKGNNVEIPTKCPACGEPTEIRCKNDSKTLYCTNSACGSKLINKLTHFVGRDAMNIDGMSVATIEKFVEKGWLKNFKDFYDLSEHENQMKILEGFGKKSIDKLLDSIDDSIEVKLENFIYAIGINGIGRHQSKILAKTFNHKWNSFESALINDQDFTQLESFGDILNSNLHEWYKNQFVEEKIDLLIPIMDWKIPEVTTTNTNLSSHTFVITGGLNHFTNRDELKSKLESMGAKVSGSVSAKTTYLINNDVDSKTGKNQKALELNIPIISEEQLLEIIGA